MLSPFDYLKEPEEEGDEGMEEANLEKKKASNKKKQKQKLKDRSPNKKGTLSYKHLRDSFPIIEDSYSLVDVFRLKKLKQLGVENEEMVEESGANRRNPNFENFNSEEEFKEKL